VHSLKLRDFGRFADLADIMDALAQILNEDSVAWGFNKDIEMREYKHGRNDLLL
jgi:hypothetical protein